MVFVIGHRAIEREEIDMDIINRHEDGNLTALFMEVFVLEHLLVGRHNTIGRRQHGIVLDSRFPPYRDAEKAYGQNQNHKFKCIHKVMP